MHEGMNPSQKRVEAYATKGLSWGSGRPARVPTHIGRVGRVRHRVPYPPFLLPSPMLPPLSLQLVLPALALAWVDKPVRKEWALPLKSWLQVSSGSGLDSLARLLCSEVPEPGPLLQGFLSPLPPLSSSPCGTVGSGGEEMDMILCPGAQPSLAGLLRPSL